jgi:hypothetical protein
MCLCCKSVAFLIQCQLNTEWTKIELRKEKPYIDNNIEFGETACESLSKNIEHFRVSKPKSFAIEFA